MVETDLARSQAKRLPFDLVKDWIPAFATLVGGFWIYSKFVRGQEKYPNIDFTADMTIIGAQGNWMLVELLAYVDNKGKAQHRMRDFRFDLYGMFPGDAVLTDERWGGQVNFPHEICKGSFLPAHWNYFFVDPGTKAKYSFIARVPIEATFLILHCRFEYTDRGKVGHTAERTVAIPKIAGT